MKIRPDGKPIVRYRPNDYDAIEAGWFAMLAAGTIDHPDLKNQGGVVYTSRVVRVGEDGEFETENTFYIPEKS